MANPPVVGPRPGRADLLKIAQRAFLPDYADPTAPAAQKASSAAAQATRSAIQRIMKASGVSSSRAKELLVQTAGHIRRRDEILSRAKKEGLNNLQIAAALRGAGIPKALLKSSSLEFVTPQGRFRTTGPPGRRRTVSLPSRPGRVPTPPAPRSTPSPRRY